MEIDTRRKTISLARHHIYVFTSILFVLPTIRMHSASLTSSNRKDSILIRTLAHKERRVIEDSYYFYPDNRIKKNKGNRGSRKGSNSKSSKRKSEASNSRDDETASPPPTSEARNSSNDSRKKKRGSKRKSLKSGDDPTASPAPSSTETSKSRGKRKGKGKGKGKDPCAKSESSKRVRRNKISSPSSKSPQKTKSSKSSKSRRKRSSKASKYSCDESSAPSSPVDRTVPSTTGPTTKQTFEPSRIPSATSAPTSKETGAPTQQQTLLPTLSIQTDRPTLGPTSSIETAPPTPVEVTTEPTPVEVTTEPTPVGITAMPSGVATTEMPTAGSSTALPTSSMTASPSQSLASLFPSTATQAPSMDSSLTTMPASTSPIFITQPPTTFLEKRTVEITPFLIEFTTTAQAEGGFPTALDFSTVADVTQSYLEQYLFEQFGADADFFEPIVANIAIDPLWGVIYSPSIAFSESLDPNFPTVEEVDAIVQEAFSNQPALVLIEDLQSLDPANVFQTTDAVEYSIYSSMAPELSTASPSPLPIIQAFSTFPSIVGSSSVSAPPSPMPLSTAPARGVDVKSLENLVRISFNIEYKSEGLQDKVGPDQMLFALTASITMKHLQHFLNFEFHNTFGVLVDSFESRIIERISEPTLAIIFEVDLSFSETSAFFPSTEEMYLVVELAFMEPIVENLINDLKQLPTDDSFQATKSIHYSAYKASVSSRLFPQTNRPSTRPEESSLPSPLHWHTRAPGTAVSPAPIAFASSSTEPSPYPSWGWGYYSPSPSPAPSSGLVLAGQSAFPSPIGSATPRIAPVRENAIESSFPSVSSEPTSTLTPTISNAPSFSSPPTALNSIEDSMMPSYGRIPMPVDLPIPPPPTKPASDQKVLATPFSLAYKMDIGQLRYLREWYEDELHVAAAAQMTMRHLEAFLVDQFQNTFEVSVKRFGSTHAVDKSSSTAMAITYAVDITFAGATSVFIPTPTEVDLIIELAFIEPAVLSLIRSLQRLPQEVTFHDTQSIVYTLMTENQVVVIEENGSLLSPAAFGVLAGGCAMLSFIACCFLMRHRSRMRYARERTITGCSGLLEQKADAMEILMPSHSYCDSFLDGSKNSNGNNEAFCGSTTDSYTGSSSSKQSRLFGHWSTTAVASETRKLYANLHATNSSSGGASSKAGAWDDRYDVWSNPPSSPGARSTMDDEGELSSLVSSASPTSMVATTTNDDESYFRPRSSPRVPCDPPASPEPRYYSSDLNIRVV